MAEFSGIALNFAPGVDDLFLALTVTLCCAYPRVRGVRFEANISVSSLSWTKQVQGNPTAGTLFMPFPSAGIKVISRKIITMLYYLHKLGGVKYQNAFSHSSGGQKSKI